MKHKLDDTDKKAAFKVPEGYFENLPMKIQKRIEAEKPTTKKQFIPRVSLALAASLALIVTFCILILKQRAIPEEMLAEVSQDELVAYLGELELDEYEIVSAFDEEVEIFETEETNMLDGIELEDQSLDDVLLEYDLEDEYL